MKMLAVLACLLVALSGCGSAPDAVERTSSPLDAVVGTHRAVGAYTCYLTTGGTATFQASTMFYLTGTTTPHRWGMYLSWDTTNGIYGGTTLAIHDSWLLESADNGAVIYNTAATTSYIHRVLPFRSYDYTQDEAEPPYSIQYLPPSPGHSYGQLSIGMYPQGYSDQLNGECAHPVGMTLEVQP